MAASQAAAEDVKTSRMITARDMERASDACTERAEKKLARRGCNEECYRKRRRWPWVSKVLGGPFFFQLLERTRHPQVQSTRGKSFTPAEAGLFFHSRGCAGLPHAWSSPLKLFKLSQPVFRVVRKDHRKTLVLLRFSWFFA